MENADNFVTAAEVTRAINQSIKAWRDLLIENEGQDFFTTTASLTMTGTGSVALTAAAYQVLSVAVLENGTRRVLRPYSQAESPAWYGTGGTDVQRYRILGANLYYLPQTSTGTLELVYVPFFTDLSADGDTVEVYNGWEEWIVLDAAMKLLEKEQTDTSQLMMRRDATERRLVSQANFRDRGMPECVSDVEPVYYRVF